MTSLEDYIEEKQVEVAKVVEEVEDDIEVKRESLAILASLGTTEEYLGVKMSLVNIKKLKPKDVEKYYNRYQAVLGKQVFGGLVESAIHATCLVVSFLISMDDTKKLSNDDLVKRELSNLAGLLVLKGGRLVALASALFQVAKHVKLTPAEENSNKIQELPSITEQPIEQTTKQKLSITKKTNEATDHN